VCKRIKVTGGRANRIGPNVVISVDESKGGGWGAIKSKIDVNVHVFPRVIHLLTPDGERMTLPGPLEIDVSDGWHVLAPSRPLALAPQTLGGDGGVLWAGTGWRLTLTTVTAAPAASDRAHEPLLALERMVPGLVPERMAVRLGATGPFVVRARRAGDRIRTPGGTRLLADIMSEAGVPRALRDQLPIVAIGDEAQEVLWVPGLAVDAARQVGPGAVADAGGVRLVVH
jgi:tRNA(Ile)-lysidine synthetase-like protein